MTAYKSNLEKILEEERKGQEAINKANHEK